METGQKKNSSKKKFLIAVKITAIFLLGAAAGSFLGYKYQSSKAVNLGNLLPIRANQDSYKLIEPLLGYRFPREVGTVEYSKFLQDTQNAINDAKKTGRLQQASIYIRDLSDNHWAGINEESQYEPASLLKVVIMMAYFKQAENNPGLISQKLTYTKKIENDSASQFDAASNLEVDKEYTIDELIKNMIVNSDNGAKNTLIDAIDINALNEFYSMLNIQNPGESLADYTISTRTYSLLFRILFNATYLNYAYSEKALELLSQVQFKDGLTAGLPDGISVAHKFGEHVAGENGTITELGLHDCGIIYYPDHPYLLCVMTLGKNLDDLSSLIKNISQLAYSQIENKYKP